MIFGFYQQKFNTSVVLDGPLYNFDKSATTATGEELTAAGEGRSTVAVEESSAAAREEERRAWQQLGSRARQLSERRAIQP